MKKPEEAMQILEAYDLTGSLRAAAALAGCDHKTVVECTGFDGDRFVGFYSFPASFV